MNRVLIKRIPRELIANFWRYLILMLLITSGMLIVVGLIAGSETIIVQSDKQTEEYKTEDGEFSTFIPLTQNEISQIENKGVTIEKKFSIDLTANEDNSTLRVFALRKNINLPVYTSGSEPKNDSEIALEARYAEKHNITSGDKITVSGKEYTVSGLAAVPDYEYIISSFSDTSASSVDFSVMLVTSNEYDRIISSETDARASDFTYAYLLNGKMTDDELKTMITDFDFDYTEANDEYFLETVEDALKDRNEFEDGINDLYDGGKELYDGMKDLSDGGEELYDSAKEFSDGAGEVNDGAKELNDGLSQINEYTPVISSVSPELSVGIKSAYRGSAELSDGTNELYDASKELADGAGELSDAIDEAKDGSKELYDGISELKDKSDEILDTAFKVDIANLTSFVKREDNVRIQAAKGDIITQKSMGILAGIVVMILFVYVISVFVVHQIKRESTVIGALYALGAKKNTLLLHFTLLPVIVAFLGGALGFFIGKSDTIIYLLSESEYNYYSIPNYDTVCPAYLYAYGLVMPGVLAFIVNALVINGKLSKTALSLLKGGSAETKHSKVKIRSNDFPTRFRIRQIFKEMRVSVAIILCLAISTVIVVLGFTIDAYCRNVSTEALKDVKYEYMYLLKYPEKTVPNGGEGIYVESLTTEIGGYSHEIAIYGISDKSKYFDAEIKEGTHSITASNAFMDKFSASVGDKYILSDKGGKTDYVFDITGETDYDAGLTVFMNIDDMRKLFGKDDDYYNCVVSEKELDIPAGRIYSSSTRDDLRKSSETFTDFMGGTVKMVVIMGFVILFAVIYLMTGVLVDRSKYGIALMKIFGYNAKNVKKLYLSGNFYMIAIGGLICLPLAKLFVNAIYPALVLNMACGIYLELSPWIYVIVYAAILVSYVIVNALMTNKLNKITPAEVLKNRE